MSPTLKKLNLESIRLSPKQKREPNKGGSRFFKKFSTWIVLAAVVFFLSLLWSNFGGASVIKLVFNRGSSLKSTDGRVNVLLLGIGGVGHDGPYLTDSIIVASYNLKSKEVTLFSIPRDVWLSSIKGKINTAYELGLQQAGTGNPGLGFAEDKIDDILGIPIHYGIVLDFSGFAKAIDLVGGVDVNVENTFDDFEYPIDGKENDLCGLIEKEIDISSDQAQTLAITPGKQKVLVDSNNQVATSGANFACRFEHIHFDKGVTHMDGETALKFVRSRHGTGTEGSDFARSRRQQLVIQSFREKLFSIQTLSNPQKLTELISTFGKSFQTDIPKEQFLEVFSLSKNVSKINSIVLGDLGGGKSLFINPPPSDYGGAWVLIPPGENFSLVSDFVKNTLKSPSEVKQ